MMNDRANELSWCKDVRLAVVAGVAFALVGLGPMGQATGESPAKTSSAAASAQTASATSPAAGSQRIREGFELQQRQGTFRKAGDRVAFFVEEGGPRLMVLENLALERIVRTIESSPVELRWQVSGTVTEYRGANYLLVRRAVALGSAARP